EELEKWAASGRTVAARLLYHVLRKGWSNVGDCEVEALPDMEISRLHQVMQDDGFIEQPLWFGDCRETTCYTRVDSPLLQRLRTRHGKGLLVRLVARLTEIAQLSMDLLPETVVAGEDFPVNVGNPGIGQVAAARGQLVHRVCLEGERVVDYRILAPTEWNFHPQGVVARALATLCGDRVRMERQARLLINAIDPCVGYELSIG
ncbi:MAG: Ni,Fe-hydrogenase I large subunit, partial [Gammaproteobacteria bacterium]|nr:Ni,Fe-hydrogenase I large subunit [Gammaproteobacteria bacterium]